MSVLEDLFQRVRFLFTRRREDRELAEELRIHAEMEAEFLQRGGMSEADARRLGLLALGGFERTKEEVRDARGTQLIEQTTSDVGFAVRTLWQRPGFAIVAILTLALGIGGTTAMFSAVDAVLLQPLPYQQSRRLVRLYQSWTGNPGQHGFVTPVHYLALRRIVGSFENLAAIQTYDETGADIGSGSGVQRIRLLQTSAEYFDVMRVHPQLGHGFETADENGAALVVLSYKLWSEQFDGDASAIGRMLTMSGKPYTVVGVMPPGFVDEMVGPVDAWVPVDLTPGLDPGNATNHFLTVVGRLRPGVTIGAAQGELDATMRELGRRYPDAKNALARIYPLKEVIVGSASKALEIMLGAVGLVLLLVCVNIANLLLVRGSERAREFAVRSALGAERARLVRQMLIESATLAVAGDVAGLLVARVAMSGIVMLGQGTIPLLATLSLNWTLLGFSLLVATTCSVLFGMAPALRAARTQPSDVLREETRSSTGSARGIRLREWLVVSQVALAFVLMVGAGLLLVSFQQLSAVDLGIKPSSVLTFEVHLPTARYDSTARATFYEELPHQIERIAGVVGAGGISKLPATGEYNQWSTWVLSGPLNKRQRSFDAEQRVIAGDYFRAVGIPLLEGRLFEPTDDALAPKRVIVSKAFAQLVFPNVDPVGRRLYTGGRGVEVIGVVGDVSVNNEGRPDVYVYHSHRQFAGDRNWALTQVVAVRDPRSVPQSEIRRTLAKLDPQLVLFRPAMLDVVIGRGASQRVFTLRVLTTFACIAIGLAALGLFGVLSYSVKLRSKEFGIRMALGADRRAIRLMVLRRGVVVAGIGIAVGLSGATALARVIASALFHVSPLDPLVLVGAVALMAAVATVAAYVPAYRATSTEPTAVLH